MNKKEFLSKYPEIKQSTLEGYLQAMKDKNLFDFNMYSVSIASQLKHDSEGLTKDLTDLCEHYRIDYRYSGEWE